MFEDIQNQIPVFHEITLTENGDGIIFPESVAILSENSSGKILFVEQYRKIQKRNTLEFPGGRVQKGEDLHNAARRELLEETGYECVDLSLIFSLDMDLSISKHITHIFQGKLINDTNNNPSNLLTHCYSLNEALILINNGIITHAPTVVGLLWLKSKRGT